MSNWFSLSQSDVAGAKVGAYLQVAQANGFDLPAAIADVTSRIRSCVSTGNELDADATKIPNSLKAVALRMIIALIKNDINEDLTPNEAKLQSDDSSFLRRVVDERLKFEKPDNPSGTAEMQATSPIQIASRSRPFVTEENLGGLL